MEKLLRALLAILFVGLGGNTAIAFQNDEVGPWQIRARGLAVLPNDSADLTVGGNTLPGKSDIGDQYVPEIDITYFINKNFAVELILSTTPHSVTASGITVPGVLDNADIDLGRIWLLPPTLTLQYHFDTGNKFKPYVGAGVNYTLFFGGDDGPVADNLDYGNSLGFALQGGFDVDFDGEPGGWFFNADVKKVWINTDVEVDFTSALGPALDVNSVIVNADVDIDPVIVGVGFGYRF